MKYLDKKEKNMGMYTEFHFNVELIENVPQEIIDILNYMLNKGTQEPLPEPDHPLFKTSRWRRMLRSDSYYFAADTHSTLRYDDIGHSYYLCIRCNLKNYDNIIEKFIDWIMPYLYQYPEDFLGFSRYENTEQPTLIYMKELTK